MAEGDVTEKIDELVTQARQEGYERGYATCLKELGGQGGDAGMSRLAADVLNLVAGHVTPGYGALIRRHSETLRAIVEAPMVKVHTHTRSELHLEFSQPMDAVSMPAHVKVAPASGGPALVASQQWDPQLRMLILRPDNGFTQGVEYRATVAGRALTVAGVPFGDDVELTFKSR